MWESTSTWKSHSPSTQKPSAHREPISPTRSSPRRWHGGVEFSFPPSFAFGFCRWSWIFGGVFVDCVCWEWATVFVLNSWVSWVDFCGLWFQFKSGWRWLVVSIWVWCMACFMIWFFIYGLVCDLLVGLVTVIGPWFVACFWRGGWWVVLSLWFFCLDWLCCIFGLIWYYVVLGFDDIDGFEKMVILRFLIFGFVFLDLGLSSCWRHTLILIHVVFSF